MPEANTSIQTAVVCRPSQQAQDAMRGATQLLWPRQVTFPAVSGHSEHLPIARITWFHQDAGPWGAKDQVQAGWMLAADQTGTSLDALFSDQEPTEAFLPTAEQLLEDPSASLWFKSALRAAMARDPVKAANEAQVLSLVLGRRADALLKKASHELRTAAPAQRCPEVHTFQLP